MENGKTPSRILGKHAIYDLSGCDPNILDDPASISEVIHRAADIAQITTLGSMEHHFEPQGYSMVLILEESHLSVHTWPEHGYAAVDLFSCSLRTDFVAVRDFLAAQFRARAVEYALLARGPVEMELAGAQTHPAKRNGSRGML